MSSRVEGGPQAIFECGLSKTPIISTDVGIAKKVLAPESLFDMENFQNAQPNVQFAYQNSIIFDIPKGFEKFNKMFKDINEIGELDEESHPNLISWFMLLS